MLRPWTRDVDHKKWGACFVALISSVLWSVGSTLAMALDCDGSSTLTRQNVESCPDRLTHRHLSDHFDTAFEHASKMEGTDLLSLWVPNLRHSSVSDACSLPRGVPPLGRAPVRHHQVSFVPASHDHLLSSMRDDTESQDVHEVIFLGSWYGRHAEHRNACVCKGL